MLVIRLARYGSKKRPFYQVVVGESARRPRGLSLEKLGYFNPLVSRDFINQDLRLRLLPDRIQYWIDRGAQVSDRVANLLKEYSSAHRAKLDDKYASGDFESVKDLAGELAAKSTPAKSASVDASEKKAESDEKAAKSKTDDSDKDQ